MDIESEPSVQSSKSLLSNPLKELLSVTKSQTESIIVSNCNTNSTSSSWMSYSLTSSYYPLLPSQMPPLPALPAINSASSPTTGGGNSSSSTYANTTASDENHAAIITSHVNMMHNPSYLSTAAQPLSPDGYPLQQQQQQLFYYPHHSSTISSNELYNQSAGIMNLYQHNQWRHQKQAAAIITPNNHQQLSSESSLAGLIYPSSGGGIGGYYHSSSNNNHHHHHQHHNYGGSGIVATTNTTGSANSEDAGATGTTTLLGDESIITGNCTGWTTPNTTNGGGSLPSHTGSPNPYYHQMTRPLHHLNSHSSSKSPLVANKKLMRSCPNQSVCSSGFQPLLFADQSQNHQSHYNNTSARIPNSNHFFNRLSHQLLLCSSSSSPQQINGFNCAKSIGSIFAVILSLAAFFSPAAMVTIPVTKVIEWPKEGIYCNVDCESQLIALTVKLILAGAAAYLTFLRRHFICCSSHRSSLCHSPRSLPRLTFLRSFLLFLVLIITIVFWLFYSIRVMDLHPNLQPLQSTTSLSSSSPSSNNNQSYHNAVKLASKMTDCLILVHYLGLVIIVMQEITQETLTIKVLRCPDGETKIYTVKKMSVQLAAVKILRNYVIDFKVYNPFVEAPARRRAGSKAGGGGGSSRGGSGSSIIGSPNSTPGQAQIMSPVLPHTNGLIPPLISGTYQPPPGALGGLAKYKFYDVDGPAPNMNSMMNPSLSSTTNNVARRSIGSPNSAIVNYRGTSHSRRKTASLRSFGNRSQRSCPLMKFSPSSSHHNRYNNNIHHQANATTGTSPQQQPQQLNSTNKSRKAHHTNPSSNSGVCGGGTSNSYSNNDRYYEEVEYEKRVAKRRVRLLLASEEAFRNLYKYDDSYRNSNVKPLDAYEAAQAIFSTLLRPLQKFLRTTRQQPRFSMEWVIGHLRNCLIYQLGYRAFVEPFLSQGPVIEDPGFQQQMGLDDKVVTSWTLISDRVVSQNISDGTVFQLQQADISLFCTVRSLPRFSLTDNSHMFNFHSSSSSNQNNEHSDKFIFKLDSETSV